MSTQGKHYGEINVVRRRAGFGQNKQQDDLLEMELTEVDKFINQSLRNHLGSYNSSGNPIIIPLTSTTVPVVPDDLVECANDLTVLRLRKDQTNTDADNKAWNDRQEYFRDIDLRRIFGWARGQPFSTPPQITLSVQFGPVGTTVTITGINFRQYAQLNFLIGGTPLAVSPVTVITDALGTFSGVTAQIPTFMQPGPTFISVRDGDGTAFDANGKPLKINAAQLGFQVTS